MMEFAAGGLLRFELNSAYSTAGVGVDPINVSSALTLSAGATPDSRFTVGRWIPVTLRKVNLPVAGSDSPALFWRSAASMCSFVRFLATGSR